MSFSKYNIDKSIVFQEVFNLKNKKTRKVIVYLMLLAMLASTLLLGIGQFLS
ncbi:stressosome-associated protein Prli42 [Neobacillus sp.]|uniref:stressosome-associated protein Prli42 n=1 Tax=Neobacillus sp. TaxID=2675273 RepID=UPI0035B52CA5